MKKRTIITTEKHEVWVIRQIKKPTAPEEGRESPVIGQAEEPLKKQSDVPADLQRAKE